MLCDILCNNTVNLCTVCNATCTYIRIYTYTGSDHVISEHDRVQTKDDIQEYTQDNDDDQPPRKRRRYVCMYVHVQCKKQGSNSIVTRSRTLVQFLRYIANFPRNNPNLCGSS